MASDIDFCSEFPGRVREFSRIAVICGFTILAFVLVPTHIALCQTLSSPSLYLNCKTYCNWLDLDLIGESAQFLPDRLHTLKQEAQPDMKTSTSSWFRRHFWIEMSGAYAYRNNDFYVEHLHDYSILESSLRIGFRKPAMIVEPYLFIRALHDVSANTWNDVDWHNNVVWGGGFRHLFSVARIGNVHFRELWIEAFAEKLWIRYLPVEVFFTGHRPDQDVRVGLRLQMVYAADDQIESEHMETPSFRSLWFEAGGSVYYAKNSFYIRDRSDFYLLGLAGKIGPAWWLTPHFHFYPYASGGMNYDLGTAAWNKLDWHNNVKFGIGARSQFLRFNSYRMEHVNFAVSLYGEFQWIRWADKVAYVPSYRPSRDFHAGVHFALSNW